MKVNPEAAREIAGYNRRMAARRPKNPPRDANQLAKLIVDISTGQAPDRVESPRAAVGRVGGRRGGKARHRRLTPEQRSDIARLAAAARWKKHP